MTGGPKVFFLNNLYDTINYSLQATVIQALSGAIYKFLFIC